MNTRKYLITCGVVAVVTVFCMLFVPPVSNLFEFLILGFLGTFATG